MLSGHRWRTISSQFPPSHCTAAPPARQAKALAAAADAPLPKALDSDADLERAPQADVEPIHLVSTVASESATTGNSTGAAPTYPTANVSLTTNPFGSSRDTVASMAAVQHHRGEREVERMM